MIIEIQNYILTAKFLDKKACIINQEIIAIINSVMIFSNKERISVLYSTAS